MSHERMKCRILIVDDEREITEILADLLSTDYECMVAGSAEEALTRLRDNPFELVMSDITMPGMSGLEVASKIAALRLNCRVLMFTMHESERLSDEVRHAGAQGFVLKSQAARDLIRAIDCLLAGGTFFGPGPPPEESASHAPSDSGGPRICSGSP